MFDMFKSPFAGGVFMGLGLSCLWLIPAGFAYLTGTGVNGFFVAVLVLLIAFACVAEYQARKRGRA